MLLLLELLVGLRGPLGPSSISALHAGHRLGSQVADSW